jgi:hypothetical protein
MGEIPQIPLFLLSKWGHLRSMGFDLLTCKLTPEYSPYNYVVDVFMTTLQKTGAKTLWLEKK